VVTQACAHSGAEAQITGSAWDLMPMMSGADAARWADDVQKLWGKPIKVKGVKAEWNMVSAV